MPNNQGLLPLHIVCKTSSDVEHPRKKAGEGEDEEKQKAARNADNLMITALLQVLGCPDKFLCSVLALALFHSSLFHN